jgi:hypothetical protein
VDSLVKVITCKKIEGDEMVHLVEPSKKELSIRSPKKIQVASGSLKRSIYDIEFIMNQELHLGGEGLFYATLLPGTVYIQSLPLQQTQLIESLLQHQKQVEIAVVKEAYWRIREFIRW